MTQSNPDAQQNEVLHFINYQYLLNDPQSMDVGFLVHQEELTEQEGKKKKTVQRIYAHTFVLADRSPGKYISFFNQFVLISFHTYSTFVVFVSVSTQCSRKSCLIR